jgi:hypothetical protein
VSTTASLLKIAALGSIFLAVISAWPGVLNDFAILAIFFYLMMMGGWIV